MMIKNIFEVHLKRNVGDQNHLHQNINVIVLVETKVGMKNAVLFVAQKFHVA